ncbi:MAG: Holliday junction branch migration protein RuvA [Chloroflexi bacterium]|nr:Holliday junction branch migration protein RuvA [Chloroflexota bacterium]
MIVAFEGILESRGIDSAVIKVGPISLQVYIPGSTLSRLGAVGDKVYLRTYLYIKDDNFALYGFASVEELELFRHLISVSGVGPKTTLAVLSTFNPEQLASAIVSGNVELLSQVPGLGKKMAGRIVLELKGKLERVPVGAITTGLTKEDADVVAALTNLGYSLKEATQAVSSLPNSPELDLEEKVKLALRQLARA